MHKEYWQQFSSLLRQRGFPLTPSSLPDANWINLFYPGRIARCRFALNATTDSKRNRISPSLMIYDAGHKRLFRQLQNHQKAIERELGAAMEWNEGPETYSCFTQWTPADPRDRSQWTQQHRWLAERFELFHEVLAPFIRALGDKTDVSPKQAAMFPNLLEASVITGSAAAPLEWGYLGQQRYVAAGRTNRYRIELIQPEDRHRLYVNDEPEADLEGTWKFFYYLDQAKARAAEIENAALHFDPSTVRLFSTVRVVSEEGDVRDWMIVPHAQQNSAGGKLSEATDVAKALVGRRAGDTVLVKTPGGAKSYEILEVIQPD